MFNKIKSKLKPVIVVEAWSSEGWAQILINGERYTYYADTAVIKRFREEFHLSKNKGKWFNYLKNKSSSWHKGHRYQTNYNPLPSRGV